MSSSSTAPLDGGSSAVATIGSTTIVSEAVSGSHVLKIHGYSRSKGLGVGNCMTSAAFAVGGHHWRLKYFPEGVPGLGIVAAAGVISLFLCLDDDVLSCDPNGVKAWFKMSLLNHHEDNGHEGEERPSFFRVVAEKQNVIFRSKGEQLGFPIFSKKKDLEKLALAEQHGCRGLKEACVNFLKFPRNFKAVVASEGFDHLKSICPSILEELVANLAL